MVGQSDWLPMMMATGLAPNGGTKINPCAKEAAHYRHGTSAGKPRWLRRCVKVKMSSLDRTMTAILDNKNRSAPSVFRPAALLREARRQKGLPAVDVPAVCILDPDGDIVRRLRKEGRSKPFEGWPCYHTQLDAFELADQIVGTNTMGLTEQDFEKGEADGTADALAVLGAIVRQISN